MLDINETVIAIRSLLSLRGFDHDCRFYQEDNKMQRQPVPWVIDGRLNMELVDYAADILGVTSTELLEMKGKVMERWSKKYPLVKYWEGMRRSVNESCLRNPTPEERLLAAVYSFTEREIYVTRYDLKKLQERTVEALTALEAERPGTIHPGEKIENFYADTVYICRYPHITEMVDSFFEMVNRGKELFFKAIEQDLSEEEICEYNLIVSYTGIRDKHFNLHGLYYRYLVKFRQLYLTEEGKDFFDYVVLSKDIPFQPWKYAEIIADRTRMEQYLSYVPRARMLMYMFAIEGTCFECSFTWSDAEPMDEEERWEFAQTYTSIWARLDEDYEGKKPTVVYIPKDDGELGEDGPYFEILRNMAGIPQEGGIPVPVQGKSEETDISKMIARVKIIAELKRGA